MKPTIEARPWKGNYELDIKRCAIPGHALKAKCPKCNAGVLHDFEDRYLSFPPVGRPFKETIYCGNCEHEWEVTLRLDLSLSVEP